MTVKEAMAFLGISRDSIYRRIANGQLVPLPKENPVRYKEPLRFSRTDVEALKQGKKSEG